MNAQFLLDPVLGHAAAASLAGVLLLGGAAKCRDLQQFEAVLDDYRLLPSFLLKPVSLLLPLIELMAGALLLWLPTRGAGAWLSLGLLALVTAAVAVNLTRGRTRIDCGCGGGDHLPLSGGIVARNAMLGLLALVALAPVQVRATVWLDLVATLFSTLFMLGLYFMANQLLSNQPRLIDLRSAP